jgi:hypothetical protein
MKNQFGPTKPPPHVPVLTEIVPESHTIPGALMVLRSPELAPEPEPEDPKLSLALDPSLVPVTLTAPFEPIPAHPPPSPSSAIATAMATLTPAAQPPAVTPSERRNASASTEARALRDPPAAQATAHQIPQITSGFGGNWWFSKDVPILAQSPSSAAMPLDSLPPALPASIDEAALVKRILVRLDSHVREAFEPRLREVATPVLTKVTDALLSQLRQQLTLSLREMVITAVVAEIARASSDDPAS